MSLQTSTVADAVEWRTVGSLVATLVGLAALLLGLQTYSPFVVASLMVGGVVLAYGLRSLWERALRADDEETDRASDASARASASETGAETDRTGDVDPSADPVAVLKLQYARGELGDEAFERRLGRLVELEDPGDDAPLGGDVHAPEETLGELERR
jgi:uncharacterized membrane protein